MNSTFNPHYRLLSNFHYDTIYSSLNCSIDKLRVLAQLRMASNKVTRVIIGAERFQFNASDDCKICHSSDKDTLTHFLICCSALDHLRSKFINKYLPLLKHENCIIEALLSDINQNKLNDIYFFVRKSLNCRQTILNKYTASLVVGRERKLEKEKKNKKKWINKWIRRNYCKMP